MGRHKLTGSTSSPSRRYGAGAEFSNIAYGFPLHEGRLCERLFHKSTFWCSQSPWELVLLAWRCAADSWSWASRASQGPEAPQPSLSSLQDERRSSQDDALRGGICLVPFEEKQGNAPTAGKRPNDELGCWEDGLGSPSTTKSSSVHSHP